MKVLLKILPKNLPEFIHKAILSELFTATADAFEVPAPIPGSYSFDERLQTYAVFTNDQAEKVFTSGQDVATIKARLYQNAFILGRRLRTWFSVDTIEEVMRLGQILYRVIGIEVYGDTQGEITVKRCQFSKYYSSQVCSLISALDDGIFSGLSGGRRLNFSERITEGKDCCRAKLFLEMNGK
jgi:hypothetical protein